MAPLTSLAKLDFKEPLLQQGKRETSDALLKRLKVREIAFYASACAQRADTNGWSIDSETKAGCVGARYD